MSGSIEQNQPPGVDNVQMLKMFLADIVKPPVIVGRYMDHVGLIAFSNTPAIILDLTQSTSMNDVVAGLDRLPEPPYGTTNTPDAILLGLQMLTSASMGARPNATKVMLLITDGHISDIYQPNYPNALAQLNSANILRIGIGITDAVNAQDLLAFVVAPRPGTYGIIDSYSELAQISYDVVNAMASKCNRPSAVYQATTTSPANP
jgi:hypothetical protein